MLKLFDDPIYTCHGTKGWPYLDTRASHEYVGDTIVFFYGITPTGRRSKYFYAVWMNGNYSSEQKEKTWRKWFATRAPKLPKRYKWSEPRLYAGKI